MTRFVAGCVAESVNRDGRRLTLPGLDFKTYWEIKSFNAIFLQREWHPLCINDEKPVLPEEMDQKYRENPVAARREEHMNVGRWIRVIAGTFVLTSLLLGLYVNNYWFLFTGFVGVNLFQSGLTNWCLMETILKKVGVPER